MHHIAQAPVWISYGGFILGAIGTVLGGVTAGVAIKSFRSAGHKISVTSYGPYELNNALYRAFMTMRIENAGRGAVTISRVFIQLPHGSFYIQDEWFDGPSTPLRLEGNDTRELRFNCAQPLLIGVTMASSDQGLDLSTVTARVGVEVGIKKIVYDEGWSLSLQDFTELPEG